MRDFAVNCDYNADMVHAALLWLPGRIYEIINFLLVMHGCSLGCDICCEQALLVVCLVCNL